jgi:hypothetical protein
MNAEREKEEADLAQNGKEQLNNLTQAPGLGGYQV